MNSKIKSVLFGVVLGMAGTAAQAAALSVTFPTGNQALVPGATNFSSNSVLYQLTTGVGTNGAFVANQTQVQGIGRVTDFNGISLASAGLCATACELTYIFGGYTYTGYRDTANNYLFTGGNLQIYLDYITPAHAGAASISTATLLSPGGAAAIANARPGYQDGFLLFDGTAHPAAAINLAQQPTVTSLTTTVRNDARDFKDNCTDVLGGTATGSTAAGLASYTVTCTVSSGPSTFAGATLSVTSDFLTGKTLVDVNSGLARSNFNHNTQFLAILPSSTGSDLSQTTTIASAGNCFQSGSNVTCLAGVTSSAFVTPAVVTLVPEPGSLALAGLSLLGLGFMRRRRNSVNC